jgi:putative tryptophan/tyrosine transport system substrate-binding protein
MRRLKRREFFTLLGGAAAWPLAARAQQRLPVIGFLNSASPIGWENYIAGFHRGLEQAGVIEGQNAKIEYRWAQGRYDKLPELAADLVARRVSVIFAGGGTISAQAVKAATSEIPIVFSVGLDPIAVGFVASFNRPGRNMTGVALLSATLVPKLVELVSAIAPKAYRIGLMINDNNPMSIDEAKVANEAATVRGKISHVISANAESDLDRVFADFADRGGEALIVSADPFFNSRRDRIIALAARHAIPTMFAWPEFPRAGGLASYGPDLADQYRLCGNYAGRIVKGEKAANLPVTQPTKFNLVVNLTTAKALHLDIPGTLLALADEVIE